MAKEKREEALLLDHQLCFPLYAAARYVTGSYTSFLKPLGLTYTQYLVFLVLWEEDEIPVGRLSERLFLDTGTLTPVLKKLEKKGYITRTRSSEDERVVLIKLTRDGQALKKKVLDVPGQVRCCCKGLTADEAGTLYGLLYKLLKGEMGS